MPRNFCLNPAAANNTTGAIATGLSDVTGLGSPWVRSTGFRSTRPGTIGNNQLNLPGTVDLGAIAGTVASATVQWSSSTVPSAFSVLLGATDAADNFIANIQDLSVTPVSGAVTTSIVRGTCPTGTRKLFVYLFATTATASSSITATACRIDLVDDPAIAYADGDTAGWGWDGTAGSSTSTQFGASWWPFFAGV